MIDGDEGRRGFKQMGKKDADRNKGGGALFSLSIMVLTAVVWMSLDIYLPALPVLREEFGVSAGYLNLTLTVGIITTAEVLSAISTAGSRFLYWELSSA